MSGLETEEIHAPAFGCGGHGEPVSFGLAFVVKTTVGALVDFGSALGIMMFITPVILGRQMSPVMLGRRARCSWADR